MAKMYCPECNGVISSKASDCPACGYPIKRRMTTVTILLINCAVLVVILSIIILENIRIRGLEEQLSEMQEDFQLLNQDEEKFQFNNVWVTEDDKTQLLAISSGGFTIQINDAYITKDGVGEYILVARFNVFGPEGVELPTRRLALYQDNKPYTGCANVTMSYDGLTNVEELEAWISGYSYSSYIADAVPVASYDIHDKFQLVVQFGDVVKYMEIENLIVK